MDRNSATGLFLIGLVVLGYMWYVSPSEEEIQRQRAIQDSIQAAQEQVELPDQVESPTPITPEEIQPETQTVTEDDSLVKSLAQQEKLARFGLFAPSSEGSDDEFRVETDLYIATFQSKGGQIKSLELKEYKTYDQAPLILFDEEAELEYIFQLHSGQLISTSDLYFSPQDLPRSTLEDGSTTLIMRASSSDPSKYVDISYDLTAGSYEVDVAVDLVGMADVVDLKRNDIVLNWEMVAQVKEKSKEREMERSGIFYRYKDEQREYLSEGKEDEEELEAKVNWVAFKQNFFSVVALHPEGFISSNSMVSHAPAEEEENTMKYNAELTLPVEFTPDPHIAYSIYAGPNKYSILKAYDNEMDRIIDLGWGIFGWMNKWLVIPIFNFLSRFISSYGVIILILTVVIKMLLFPLTYKNYLSSAKMRALKPEIDELNKKFENEKDPMKKQQATMSLYKRSGVNPAAGCLPMLVQMPILYAMFRFFPASIELRQEPFLWADDLSSYDSILDLPFEIPLYGDHISLFTLLMALSTFLYT
ncbi:MAG: membrane protein insertase YidC, partial [Flavobacteriales bacterium]|nr:membrane protein insertase YidC [Flavobacteriales bacterium]